MEQLSPYASPESAQQTSTRDPEVLYTDGVRAIVPQRAIFPERCIGTGDTAGLRRKKELLLGLPWWMHTTRMICFPVYLILLAISQHRCRVEFSYKPYVNRKRQLSCAGIGALLFISGNLLAVYTPLDWHWKTYLAFTMISSGLCFISEARHRLSAGRSEMGWHFIYGCSPAFLQDLQPLEKSYGALVLPQQD